MDMTLFSAMLWIFLAACFSCVATWGVGRSQGFSRPLWGGLSVCSISAAFFCIMQALHVVPLAIAYASWSVLGILGTTTIGCVVFKQPLTRPQWMAISLLIAGIVLINMG